jgi:hypothetical protein
MNDELLSGRAGQRETVTTNSIEAKEKWNCAGVRLQQGARYRFEIEKLVGLVDGDGPDAQHLDDLDGWEKWYTLPLFFLKRRPFERYFTLIGTIGRKHPFRMRAFDPEHPERITLTAPSTGKLICYFNDWPWLYGNNHGSVILRVSLVD